MKLKQILLCSLIVMCCAPLGAQTSKEEMFATPEKTGGVYWAYPLDFAPQTKAPKGYKPFYISHYGRHGSRYLIADRDYKWLVDLLRRRIVRKRLPVWERIRISVYSQFGRKRKGMVGI